MLDFSSQDVFSTAAQTGTQRIAIILAPEHSAMSLSALMDPLYQANSISGQPLFEVETVALVSNPVQSNSGLSVLATKTLTDFKKRCFGIGKPDLIILCCSPVLDGATRSTLSELIRDLKCCQIPVFGTGGAAFAMADAKLVNNASCTTHWSSLASLSEQHYDVVVENRLVAGSPNALTCPGELAAFDLVVHHIQKVAGDRIASEVCRYFIAHIKRDKSTVQIESADLFLCKDPIFQKTVKLMLENIEVPLTAQEIAEKNGCSTRQVERVFARNGYPAPVRFYLYLRLDRAKILVEQTELSVLEISLACGFSSLSGFSRRFKERFGKTPTQVRCFN